MYCLKEKEKTYTKKFFVYKKMSYFTSSLRMTGWRKTYLNKVKNTNTSIDLSKDMVAEKSQTIDFTKPNKEDCMVLGETQNSTKTNNTESMVAENGQKFKESTKTPKSMVAKKSQNS